MSLSYVNGDARFLLIREKKCLDAPELAGYEPIGWVKADLLLVRNFKTHRFATWATSPKLKPVASPLTRRLNTLDLGSLGVAYWDRKREELLVAVSDQLFVLRKNARKMALQCETKCAANWISVSPNGLMVAFSCQSGVAYHPGNRADCELFLLDRRNGVVTKLGVGSQPNWSPDGRKVVVIDGRPSDARRVLIYTLGKRSPRVVLSPDVSAFRHVDWLSGDSLLVVGERLDDMSSGVHEFGLKKRTYTTYAAPNIDLTDASVVMR